jgi:hypothetical protein
VNGKQWVYFIVVQSLGVLGLLFGNFHITPFLFLLALLSYPGLLIGVLFET